MNGKHIRMAILAALALAGGAQAGTNAVQALDVGEYQKKALDLIRRAGVPSLQVTMTSPEGVLSFCVVNDAFYAAPGRQLEARPIDEKSIYEACSISKLPLAKGMAIMIPERKITLCYFFNGDTRYNLHGPLTDLFLKPKNRLYAHTGGIPLPAHPLGTVPGV